MYDVCMYYNVFMSIASERNGEMELKEKRQTVETRSVLNLFVTIYYFNIFILGIIFSFLFYCHSHFC